MVRSGVRSSSWIALGSAIALLLALVSAPVASADDTTSTVVVDYGATNWSYRFITGTVDDGFSSPSFDASKWDLGTAGFGTSPGQCAWNNSTQVQTRWEPNGDVQIRRSVSLPVGTTRLHISGIIDNDVTVYFNGTALKLNGTDSTLYQGDNCQGNFSADVPSNLIFPDNVIALRGHDRGNETFLDVQVTAFQDTVPTPVPGNSPPIFTASPDPNIVIHPGDGNGFRITAEDTDGDPITLTWKGLPPNTTKVDCQPTDPSPTNVAERFCYVTALEGGEKTYEITFTATDNIHKSYATTKVTVGDAPAIYGGTPINFVPSGGSGGEACTAGFAAIKPSTSTKYIVTAGHCWFDHYLLNLIDAKSGDSSTTFANKLDCFADSSVSCLHTSKQPNDMMAWQPEKAVPTAKVLVGNKYLPVLGTRKAGYGSKVCWTGRTTGHEACARIMPTIEPRAVLRVFKGRGYVLVAGDPIQSGDSGSLMYQKAPNGTGVYAVGMALFGPSDDLIKGLQLTDWRIVYGGMVPVSAIEANLGVKVLTSSG